MAVQFKIIFAASALRDLEDVLEYYKEQKIPDIGEKVVAKVIKNIELLGNEPDMGRIVPEFELEYLKELIRPPFRIVYRKDKKKVFIVRVWRSERLLIL